MLNYIWDIQRTDVDGCRAKAQDFFCWFRSNLNHLKEAQHSQCCIETLVSSPLSSRAVVGFTQSWEDEWCFSSVSRLQSQSSVIAANSLMVAGWLASLNLLCQQQKKGLKLFLPGVKASFRLLIGLPSQPGANTLHLAHYLFCCYHPPAASVWNNTSITAWW